MVMVSCRMNQQRGGGGSLGLSSGMQRGIAVRNAGEVMVVTTERGQGPWPRRVNQNSCGPENLGDVGKRRLSTNPTTGPTGKGLNGRSDPRPTGS